ncbi:MAG: hypothetical protein HGGPFJEG_01048 [Ignavibacteria bacterium]|nr:hypothetical protein [Ignavibacteria bacterium]
MITLLIILLVIVSIVLMGVVLLQSSKGNGLAGTIGGSSVTMAFGVRRTSDLLSKSTTVLAAVLIVGCIAVNLLIGSDESLNESIIQKNAGQQQQQSLPPNTIPPTENTPPQNTPPPVENQQNDKGSEKKELENEKQPSEVAPLDK